VLGGHILLNMMSLEETYIRKFKDAYQKDFGEALTDKEASERFFRLVRLLRTVLYGAPSNPPDAQPSGPRLVDESEFNANLKD